MGDKTPDARVRTYADIMREQQLNRELDNTMVNIAKKKRDEAETRTAAGVAGQTAPPAAAPSEATSGSMPAPPAPATDGAAGSKRRNRWDQAEP